MTSDELKLKELAELMIQPQGNMVDGGDWIAKRIALQQEFRIAANPATILSLLARIEALEQDATRYQLMRNTDWQDLEVIRLYAGPDFDQLMGNDLDARLDAIAQQDKGKETV